MSSSFTLGLVWASSNTQVHQTSANLYPCATLSPVEGISEGHPQKALRHQYGLLTFAFKTCADQILTTVLLIPIVKMASDNASSSKPLAEWQSIVEKDVLTLNQFMLLRTHKDDEESRKQMAPWFRAVADSVSDIERIARNLSRYVAEEEAKLKQLERLEQSIDFQTQRFAMMKAQMPGEVLDCLGLHGKPDAAREDTKKENDQAKLNKQKEPDVQRKPSKPAAAAASSPKPKITRKQSRTGSRKKGNAAPQTKKEAPPSAEVPVITSVSQEELDAAPQYVKGRLTIEKIDGVVNSLNSIVTSKYTLLARPYRDLNSAEITQWQDFRENECDETNGKDFLTDTEIKGFGNYRLDATAKSVINVLRHVGSLKEVRGKNRSRIFIIN